MINRVLIRIKVVQMLYNYMLTRNVKSLTMARDELQQSFDKSYELYNYLLKLIIDLTDLQDRYLDDAKHKYLPTQEDLNPNPKFIDNQLAEALRNNEQLQHYLSEHKLTWRDNELFLKLMLNKLLASSFYNEYMLSSNSDLESDCQLWRQFFKHIILLILDENFNHRLSHYILTNLIKPQAVELTVSDDTVDSTIFEPISNADNLCINVAQASHIKTVIIAIRAIKILDVHLWI